MRQQTVKKRWNHMVQSENSS